MRTTYTILVAAITLMAAEQASAQSNYWDPRPISRDKQEQPTNTNPARIITAAPKMPASANRSGYCCAIFDVTKDGVPEDINTTYCNQKKFKRPTIRAIKKWRFKPAIDKGTPLHTYDKTVIMTFRLTNEEGDIILDSKKSILRNGVVDFSKEHLCPNLELL